MDLGCDAIWHYKVENKKVVKLNKTVMEEGSGHRHMTVHQKSKLVFVVFELKSQVEYGIVCHSLTQDMSICTLTQKSF